MGAIQHFPQPDSPVAEPPDSPGSAPVANAMALARLQQRAGDAAALLKALANPNRLLLLCHLVEAERSVTELGAITGIGQPTLSQQLGVLRGQGLVATRRAGKAMHYRIASPAAMAVLRTLYDLFCAPTRSPSTELNP